MCACHVRLTLFFSLLRIQIIRSQPYVCRPLKCGPLVFPHVGDLVLFVGRGTLGRCTGARTRPLCHERLARLLGARVGPLRHGQTLY